MQQAAFITFVADHLAALRKFHYAITPVEAGLEREHDERFARDLYEAHSFWYSIRTDEEIRRELFPTIQVSLQGALCWPQ